MSEHKWQEAYKKGFEDGKRNAFSLYCYECYDELSEYEQVKLMVEWGADISNILDKIKAEIEDKYGDYDICEWFDDYDYEENNISEYRQVGDMSDILAIIDKYKEEV